MSLNQKRNRGEASVESEEIMNNIERKVGRNILLFQQIEHLIKFIVANGKVEGYISELEENQKKRKEAIHKQTLGPVVKQYMENTHSEEIEADPADLKEESHVSFTMKMNIDADFYEERKQTLDSLVAERNYLVHHLLPRLNPHLAETWNEVERYLDNQHEKFLPELNRFRGIIENGEVLAKALSEFLLSGEWERPVKLSWLQQSPLALLLGEIADQAARHDGWTLLSRAGQLIRQQASEEIAALNSRYGHKSLKSFLLATELFEVMEEPTVKGGTRVLYRLKPE